jgi:hypothetical protein
MNRIKKIVRYTSSRPFFNVNDTDSNNIIHVINNQNYNFTAKENIIRKINNQLFGIRLRKI